MYLSLELGEHTTADTDLVVHQLLQEIIKKDPRVNKRKSQRIMPWETPTLSDWREKKPEKMKGERPMK